MAGEPDRSPFRLKAFNAMCYIKHMENPIEICPYCKCEVSHYEPDAVSYCQECEVVVEGSTMFIESNDQAS